MIRMVAVKNEKGFTLVELILSLALLALLMGAAMKIISVNLRAYSHNKVYEEAEIVADYLLTSIENEVSNATGGAKSEADEREKRCHITLGIAKVSESKEWPGIQYYDKDGRLSCIYLDKDTGELVFHKYRGNYLLSIPERTEAADGYTELAYEYYGKVDESGKVAVCTDVASNAKLPEENYKGFTVTDIIFGTNLYYRPYASVFTVTVILKNEIYDFEYSKGMTIESYNGAFIKGPYKTHANGLDTDIPEKFAVD